MSILQQAAEKLGVKAYTLEDSPFVNPAPTGMVTVVVEFEGNKVVWFKAQDHSINDFDAIHSILSGYVARNLNGGIRNE